MSPLPQPLPLPTFHGLTSVAATPQPSAPASPGQSVQEETPLPDYLRLILTAQVYDVARETPLEPAPLLTSRLGHNVLLKREDLQPVFSFKCRGAYNRMANLTPEEMARGVVACSAGNHAQGVSLAAAKLGISATIVMPLLTPEIKINNVRRLGASVVLYGMDFDEAKVECTRLAELNSWTNIPPFDDPYVIAGQGTVGVEILRQTPIHSLGAIFVASGGGGLLAGVSAYVKRIAPHVKVIGVEAVDAAGMAASFDANARVELPEVGLFADGAAVRLIGKETYRICRAYVDELVLVTNDELCAAIKDTFEDTRAIVEPAGALGLAGLKKWLGPSHSPTGRGEPNKSYVAILSGANMNFDRLRFVAERAEIGENREALLSVSIPEKPGSFLRLHNVIYPRATTEFAYRYGHPETAQVFFSFACKDREAELPDILDHLERLDFDAIDISNNELAKSHARFMVGGRGGTAPPYGQGVPNERAISFAFPERPGALRKFLTGLDAGWNVSLFHYRNIGGDNAKVLVGIQVPPSDDLAFQLFLKNLGFPWVEETDNVVYQRFLR